MGNTTQAVKLPGIVKKVLAEGAKLIRGDEGMSGQAKTDLRQHNTQTQNVLDELNSDINNTSPQDTPGIQKIFEK